MLNPIKKPAVGWQLSQKECQMIKTTFPELEDWRDEEIIDSWCAFSKICPSADLANPEFLGLLYATEKGLPSQNSEDRLAATEQYRKDHARLTSEIAIAANIMGGFGNTGETAGD